MQWQHYNKLKSVMSYIEGLVYEIESSLAEKNIYKSVEIDLTPEQIKHLKYNLNKLYNLLYDIKKVLGLKKENHKLSRIIDVNTGFIWMAIEDAWSSKMEKSSGKIGSSNEKKQIDELLAKIMDLTNKIRKTAKYDAL